MEYPHEAYPYTSPVFAELSLFFPKMDHHVPRLPLSYSVLPGFLTELRVKHYGWAISPEELRRKYSRYLELDPEGRWGSLEQYESILDEQPHLVEWQEEL